MGNTTKVHCTAFCPKCGSDLYYFEHECICKNKECNWSCGGCKDYRETGQDEKDSYGA